MNPHLTLKIIQYLTDVGHAISHFHIRKDKYIIGFSNIKGPVRCYMLMINLAENTVDLSEKTTNPKHPCISRQFKLAEIDENIGCIEKYLSEIR